MKNVSYHWYNFTNYKSISMLPYRLWVLTRRGRSWQFTKIYFPLKKPLFTCSKAHREWQVTQYTKFRQVVNKREKWHLWLVTDELCIHHAAAGETGRWLVSTVCRSFISGTPRSSAHGKTHSCPGSVLLHILTFKNF